MVYAEALISACHRIGTTQLRGSDVLLPHVDLVSVGDLVAKGPQSIEVVRYVREHFALCIKGNHELELERQFERIQRARARGISATDVPDMEDEVKYRKEHSEVAAQMTEEEYNWIKGLPLWATVEFEPVDEKCTLPR